MNPVPSQLPPQTDPLPLLRSGEDALRSGDFAACDAALRGALAVATDPLDRARVLDAMVRLGLDVGEDAAAQLWLDECLALRTQHAGPISPEVGRCHSLRAQLYSLADQDHRRAAESWQRAAGVLIGPARADALIGLGLSRLELLQLDAAQQALDQARAQLSQAAATPQSDHLLARIEEACARLCLAQGQPQRALTHLHTRVALVHRLSGPQSQEAADTLLMLAAVAETDHDIESAVSAMDRAVELLAVLLGKDATETTMAAAYLLALRARLAGAPEVPR